MADMDGIAFNIAAFIGGLFILEFGADKFIDHTAALAKRLRVPPTLIALLTAGAEWEELAVVIASISQSQSPLALGNILGSSISNIFGAFSLGLIFSPTSSISFDRSSKIYTSVLLGLTSLFLLFILFGEDLGRVGGGVLVSTFVVYIASIAWAIYKGVVAPPEDSDSDSDSDPDSDSDSNAGSEGDEESCISLKERKGAEKAHLLLPSRPGSSSSNATTLQDHESPYPSPAHKTPVSAPGPGPTELSASIFKDAEAESAAHPLPFTNISLSAPLTPFPSPRSRTQRHSTPHHLAHFTLGLLALSLSGYILSHTFSSLSTLLSLSSTVLGTTFLSLATTLPEKLISVLSARRGENGIVVANTVGSNVFLVTLCAGVLFLTGDLGVGEAGLNGKRRASVWEVGWVWGGSAVLWGVVCGGWARRWMGWVGLGAYVVFLVVEW